MVARSTPRVAGTMLIGWDGTASSIAVGTPAWYAWLEGATTLPLASAQGGFTARKERRGTDRLVLESLSQARPARCTAPIWASPPI